MDISQLIGFVVSLFFFFFYLYKKVSGEHKPHRDLDEENSEDRLKAFLKSINEDEEEEEIMPIPPPPPPKPAKKKPSPSKNSYTFKTDLDAYQEKTGMEMHQFESGLKKSLESSSIVSNRYLDSSSYHEIKKEPPSRAKKLISSLRSKKEMVILHEIFSRPKSQ